MPFDLMALRMMLLDLILPQKTLLRGVARLGWMRIGHWSRHHCQVVGAVEIVGTGLKGYHD